RSHQSSTMSLRWRVLEMDACRKLVTTENKTDSFYTWSGRFLGVQLVFHAESRKQPKSHLQSTLQRSSRSSGPCPMSMKSSRLLTQLLFFAWTAAGITSCTTMPIDSPFDLQSANDLLSAVDMSTVDTLSEMDEMLVPDLTTESLDLVAE